MTSISRRILRRLLTNGYFPRELPPPFTTRHYGLVVARQWGSLPACYLATNKESAPARHSLVRSGHLRRQLAIPNPILFPQLCFELATNWTDLETLAKSSPYSKSRPVFHRRGARTFLPLVPKQGDLVSDKAAIRAGGRVLVAADITRFYGSIYTHSVPWALHGKETAKRKRRDYTLLGNRMDRALRLISAGQTIGIPIGPDPSLVIAEALLAGVDVELAKRFPQARALRYVDEYEVATSSQDEAEELMAKLQQLLTNYELELNPLKTSITTLPSRLESPWVSGLRSRTIRDSIAGEATDIVALFDTAFEHSADRSNSPVLRYLMGRLKNQRVKLQNWRLYQHLLLQCMTAEPATIQGAMTTLIPHLEANFGIERGDFISALNSIIELHASLGHGNEVAWALWSMMTLNLKISGSAVDALCKMTDPAVVLLALHAETLQLLDKPLDKQAWVRLAVKESLYDEHWLLAYEGTKKGWLPVSPSFIQSDPGFAFLWKNNVEFYDVRRITQPKPTGVPPSLGFAPSFY